MTGVVTVNKSVNMVRTVERSLSAVVRFFVAQLENSGNWAVRVVPMPDSLMAASTRFQAPGLPSALSVRPAISAATRSRNVGHKEDS